MPDGSVPDPIVPQPLSPDSPGGLSFTIALRPPGGICSAPAPPSPWTWNS